MTGGDWQGDHYLYLNDKDRNNATSGYCSQCTRHEFKLTNTSADTQKVYAQVHTWDDKVYSFYDTDCSYNWHYVKFDIPGEEDVDPERFAGTYQVIYEM